MFYTLIGKYVHVPLADKRMRISQANDVSGGWHHVVVVFDGGDGNGALRLYYDGVLAGSATCAYSEVPAHRDPPGDALTYTWSATSGLAPVTFSANGQTDSDSTEASFQASGTYTIEVLGR